MFVYSWNWFDVVMEYFLKHIYFEKKVIFIKFECMILCKKTLIRLYAYPSSKYFARGRRIYVFFGFLLRRENFKLEIWTIFLLSILGSELVKLSLFNLWETICEATTWIYFVVQIRIYFHRHSVNTSIKNETTNQNCTYIGILHYKCWSTEASKIYITKIT